MNQKSHLFHKIPIFHQSVSTMLWLTNILPLLFATTVSCLLNGKEVKDLRRFPHHVFLKIKYTTGLQYYCGGSILSSQFVVTSKSCVDNVASLQVVARALSTQDTSALYIDILESSQSIIQSSDLGEFALIKLPEPLPFTDFIKPIKFIEDNLEWGGHKVTIAGLSETNNRNGSMLTYGEFEVIHTKDCGADHGDDFLGPSYKCFLSRDRNIFTYPCFGNLGEAVLIEDEVYDWRMIGVVIKSDTCVTKISGIFSNIQPSTLTAINDIIN